MKTNQLITLLFAGFLYLGCNNAGEKTEKAAADSTVKEKETEVKKEVLELNQGAKWTPLLKPIILIFNKSPNKEFRKISSLACTLDSFIKKAYVHN